MVLDLNNRPGVQQRRQQRCQDSIQTGVFFYMANRSRKLVLCKTPYGVVEAGGLSSISSWNRLRLRSSSRPTSHATETSLATVPRDYLLGKPSQKFSPVCRNILPNCS